MADSDLCVLELVPWDRVGAQPHLLAMVTEHADIVNTTDKSQRYHHHHHHHHHHRLHHLAHLNRLTNIIRGVAHSTVAGLENNLAVKNVMVNTKGNGKNIFEANVSKTRTIQMIMTTVNK